MADLNSELMNLEKQFLDIRREIEALMLGLDQSLFSCKPPSGAWSVAECLDHLNVTALLYLPAMHQGIRRGKEHGITGAPPFRYGILECYFVRTTEPPPPIRFKAPKPLMPTPGQNMETAVPGFIRFQEAYIEALHAAQGLDLSRIKIASPFSNLVRFSLGKAFQLMAAHERRHIWQARQVIAAAGFPKA